ncbi:MAG: phytoene desaturase family protein [Candidatus Competibacteraceae bacterium]|jgi:phytoene desaturase|nr:phytoene desaturase family protein [Candidatus Competibacteraceae bacterium]
MPTALVVGAGFGGIAAALRLRARGYQVTVIDRASLLGGRAQVFRRGDFVFDAGPTVITAPFLIDELFALFGRDSRDYVELKPLDTWYRIRFPDGQQFNYGGSVDDTLAEIARFNPADCDGYLRLVETSRRIFEVGFSQLAHQPFHRFSEMLKQLPRLLALRSYRTVYGLVAAHIKHPALRQAFSLQPLLVGGNPFDTTSIYVLIHYLERKWGVHFAMGGTGALVAGLGRLMTEVGIDIRLNETVSEILIEQGDARGVRLENGQQLSADLVVVNGDPPYVYKHLIPAQHRRQWSDKRIERLRYSMGLFVLYFGTTRQYPDVAHHTIWLGQTYKKLLKNIFHRQVLSDDFSLYLHRPTATDPSMAPAGCDSFYVLSPVPNLQSGIDWETEGPRYQQRIVEALHNTILPGLKEHLVHDFTMTPVDFKNNYLSHWGTGFSIAPLFSQSAYFRFHNRADDIGRLYFVGAGTHPGAGVPGVLSSAKVLDSLIPPAHQWQNLSHAHNDRNHRVTAAG